MAGDHGRGEEWIAREGAGMVTGEPAEGEPMARGGRGDASNWVVLRIDYPPLNPVEIGD